MTRAPLVTRVSCAWAVFVLAPAFAWPQLKTRPKDAPQTQQTQTQVAEPPEEDSSYKPKEYAFNPLRSDQELKVGNFYFKKGDYKAAAHRFDEAGKWNPGSAEAFLRLGEAEEKLKDKSAAGEAYAKYLALAPDAKNAAAIRKKIPKTGKTDSDHKP